MEINRRILVNKSLRQVWSVLSDEFGDVHKWDSEVSSSRLEGKGKLLGLNYSSRILETSEGQREEVMTTHESNTYSLSYRCKEGLPVQIRKISTNWSMANTENGVEVRIQQNVKLSVFGLILYPFILYKQGEEASRILEEFNGFIEGRELK
jgi:hypothetical protein